MLQLFRIEWLKIKNYRTFWILAGGFTLFFPVFFYFIANRFMASSNSNQEETIKQLLGNPFTYPKVWHSSSYFGGLFFIMIGMLFILLITNEVQFRTHRQNIIDGWSRMNFLLAKLSVLIFLVIVSTIVVVIAGLWVGIAYSPATDNIFEGFHYVGYFALMSTIYLMVAYLIAILVKRTGLSIILYFALVCLVDNLLWLLLTLKDSQVGYFLPLESTDSLIPNPFKPIEFEKRTVGDSSLMIAASAYLVLMGYFIINYFKRIDLKT